MNTARHPLKVLIICLTRRGGLLQFNDCLVENLTQFCEVGVITTEGAEHAQMNWDQHVAYSRIIDFKSEFTATHSSGVAAAAVALPPPAVGRHRHRRCRARWR